MKNQEKVRQIYEKMRKVQGKMRQIQEIVRKTLCKSVKKMKSVREGSEENEKFNFGAILPLNKRFFAIIY